MVPPELIAACGLTPCRLAPIDDTDARREGLCSFAAAWLSALQRKQAAGESFVSIFTSACDQMRRSFDLLAAQNSDRTFLLNIPATTTENAFAWYKQELSRLAEFLCGISGQTPDWTKAVASPAARCIHNQTRLRIAVTGESTPETILHSLQSIVSRFDASVLDFTDNVMSPQDINLADADPLERLARANFELPAIWKRPNTAFYQWLSRKALDHHVSGIIVLRHNFCDLWRTAKPEMINQLAQPVLELDLDGQGRLSEWAVSRIEAFVETVQ
jgi:benzoyl-CoA reductase/2-hydroxyglutaryl-CoA dehydratase subunit BcrC/BadD/HgdB